MASAEAAPASPSVRPSSDYSDEELTAITNALGAVTLDGTPDFQARMDAYDKFRSMTMAFWDELDARKAAKSGDEDGGPVVVSVVPQKSPISYGYQGIGPAPKIPADIPRQSDHGLFKSAKFFHKLRPEDLEAQAGIPLILETGAETLSICGGFNLEHELAATTTEFASTEEESSNQDLTWLLRKIDQAVDDVERENIAEAWDRILPTGSWKAVYDIWSAEMDKKEAEAMRAVSEVANKAKGKGKVKK